MCSETEAGDWDLTPAIDCLWSNPITSRPCPPDYVFDQREVQTELGNLDDVWRYLGQPLYLPPPTVKPLFVNDLTTGLRNEADSDEAAFRSIDEKEVRWRDEVEGTDIADSDELGDTAISPCLSKAERKKERRKQRQQLERNIVKTLPSGNENENESERELRKSRRSSDRKSVIHRILYGSPQKAEGNGDRRLPRGPGIPGKPDLSSITNRPQISRIIQRPISSNLTPLGEAAAKKAGLIKMLHERFVDERKYLSNVSLTQGPADGDVKTEAGIHVFVDASNIMIGFHDALKLSRGLTLTSRIRRQPLSFHNLSLVLERGRPISKRILVGSDNFPAIQEAKSIGYETNILDRVHKAKELTPRQKKFTNKSPTRNSNINSATSGQSSGSETTAAITHAPEKWVEQAVDEILHLKILESVVDATEPSTMVLATGDAAEAEYSQGFLKMVERALGKGWKVELISFRHNISGAYRRKEFRGRWSGKFRIVELDEFVEELLGV